MCADAREASAGPTQQYAQRAVVREIIVDVSWDKGEPRRSGEGRAGRAQGRQLVSPESLK